MLIALGGNRIKRQLYYLLPLAAGIASWWSGPVNDTVKYGLFDLACAAFLGIWIFVSGPGQTRLVGFFLYGVFLFWGVLFAADPLWQHFGVDIMQFLTLLPSRLG